MSRLPSVGVLLDLHGEHTRSIAEVPRQGQLTKVFAVGQGVAEPLYSLALFVPTIISSLGKFTRAESQLLSTPPYFLAFGITMWV